VIHSEPDDADVGTSTSTSSHAGERLFAGEKYAYKVLTGSADDKNKMGRLIFHCLSIIGAHGSAGILQPDLRKIAGQDKTSVPGRTDKLANWGYIEKRAVLAHGTHTSLLILSRFAQAETANEESAEQGLATANGTLAGNLTGRPVIDYDLSFDSTISLMKAQPNWLIAVQDLRLGLGIHLKKFETRYLMRCIRRMANSGCFRKLSAKPTDEDGMPIASHGVRCVQLMREPTEEDRSTWKMMRGRRKRSSNHGAVESIDDEDADGVTDEEVDELLAGGDTEIGNVAAEENDDPKDIAGDQVMEDAHEPESHATAEETTAERAEEHVDEAEAPIDGDASLTHETDETAGEQIVAAETLVNDDESSDAHSQVDETMTDADTMGGAHLEQERTPSPLGRGRRKRKATEKAIEQAEQIDDSPEETSTETGVSMDRANETETSRQSKSVSMAEDAGENLDNEDDSDVDGTTIEQKQTAEDITEVQTPAPSSIKKKGKAKSAAKEKPLKHRKTSERDQPEFEKWAHATAERIAKHEARRRASTEEEPTVPEEDLSERVDQVESDLLARIRPGIYINPPGARDLKAMSVYQRGRPRNALIAVVKSDRLGDLEFFKDDGGPKVPRKIGEKRRASAVAEDTPIAEDLPAAKKRKVGAEKEPDQVAEDDAEERDDEAPASNGTLVSYEVPSSNGAPASKQISTPVVAKKPTYTREYVQAHPDEQFHYAGGGRYRKGPKPGKVPTPASSTATNVMDTIMAEVQAEGAAAPDLIPSDADNVIEASDTAKDSMINEARPTSSRSTRRASLLNAGQHDASHAGLPRPSSSRSTRRSSLLSARQDATSAAEIPRPSSSRSTRSASALSARQDVTSAAENPRPSSSRSTRRSSVLIAKPDEKSMAPPETPAPATSQTARPPSSSTKSPYYDKAYVQAHPEENFHHVGHGRYRRRGDTAGTVDSTVTPGNDAMHRERTPALSQRYTKRKLGPVPDTGSPESSPEPDDVRATPAGSGRVASNAAASMPPPPPPASSTPNTNEKEPTFDKAYVDAHPGEEFYHAGWGHFKHGAKPTVKSSSLTPGEKAVGLNGTTPAKATPAMTTPAKATPAKASSAASTPGSSVTPMPSASLTPFPKKRGRPSKAMLAERARLASLQATQKPSLIVKLKVPSQEQGKSSTAVQEQNFVAAKPIPATPGPTGARQSGTPLAIVRPYHGQTVAKPSVQSAPSQPLISIVRPYFGGPASSSKATPMPFVQKEKQMAAASAVEPAISDSIAQEKDDAGPKDVIMSDVAPAPDTVEDGNTPQDQSVEEDFEAPIVVPDNDSDSDYEEGNAMDVEAEESADEHDIESTPPPSASRGRGQGRARGSAQGRVNSRQGMNSKARTNHRTSVILEMVERCGGVFPGSGEIYDPFAQLWRQTYDSIPDRRTLEAAIKGLVASGKLRKYTFSFRTKQGMNQTKAVLALPSIQADSALVEEMKRKIIEQYPTVYIPDIYDNPRKSWKDEFPTVQGLQVQRTSLSIQMADEEARVRGFEDARARMMQKQKTTQISGPARRGRISGLRGLGGLQGGRGGRKALPPRRFHKLMEIFTVPEWSLTATTQTFHTASGTFGTVGDFTVTRLVERPFALPSNTVQKTPASLDEIIERVDPPLSKPYGDQPSPVSQFKQEIDRVAKWEQDLVQSNSMLVDTEGWQFINHTLNQPHVRIICSVSEKEEGFVIENMETAEDGPELETFTKAYIDAHPLEEFHHVGFGRYRRGPMPHNQRYKYRMSDEDRRYTREYVEAHPNQEFYPVEDGLYKKAFDYVDYMPRSSRAAESPYFNREYVEAHPKEEFWHIGGGRYRRGTQPREPRQPLKRQPAKAPVPMTFDKAYVDAHPEQDFINVGNGLWKAIRTDAQGPTMTPTPNAAPGLKRTRMEFDPRVGKIARGTRMRFRKGAELFDREYVDTHKNELFVHVGGGRFRRKEDVVAVEMIREDGPPERLSNMLTPTLGPSTQPYAQNQAHPGALPWYALDGRTSESPQVVASSPLQPAEVNGQPMPKYQSRKRRNSTDLDFANVAPGGDLDYTPGQPEAKRFKIDMGGRRAGRKPTTINFAHQQDLMVAVALLRILTGGLQQANIKWEIVAHAMGYLYEADFLRERWAGMRLRYDETAHKMQEQLREPFLAAYEKDELPTVNFQDLASTDWPGLLQWAKSIVALPAPEPVNAKGKAKTKACGDYLELPGSADAVHELYTISDDRTAVVHDEGSFFEALYTGERNMHSLRALQGVPMDFEPKAESSAAGQIPLLKSWCRAVCLTTRKKYNAEAAAKKIGKFPGALIKQASDELVMEKILSPEKKGRQLPGRNFSLSVLALKTFKRWPGDDATYLPEIAAARERIVAWMEANDEFELTMHTNDADIVVLSNMVQQGLLKISNILPPQNDALDAPLPKLSVWGVDEPHTLYDSKAVDPARMRFPMVYRKTEHFTSEHGLRQVPIPLSLPIVPGEKGSRIPLWIDIHGNLIEEMWEMVLRSMLHILVYRPGLTVAAMEKAHKGMFWGWEVEVVLKWMEESGLAERFGNAGDGWKASEWWYCAFGRDFVGWGGD
jgi:hypothetical protein